MDPFNKLPAEIRLHICSWLRIRSKRAILLLVQASPVMLRQYITSKAHIARTALLYDLDDDMIQDAMKIILFPYWKTTIADVPVSRYRSSWAGKQLLDPFKTHDRILIEKMDKLYSRLLLFIEDYLTKAMAAFPPREYLCLPDISSIHGHLMFRGEAICPRFDVANLTTQERRRLLKAFLRFELICKTCYERKPGQFSRAFKPLLKYGGRKFRPSEREAIQCVNKYLESLYGAMFAQCGDSWLPDTPEGSLSSCTTGLLYPDTLYVNANVYASDAGFGDSQNRNAQALACCGFDLFTALLPFTTCGRHGWDRLGGWLRDIDKTTRDMGFPYHVPSPDGLPLTRYDKGVKDKNYQRGPGMYQLLYPRIADTSTLHRNIYRQRAWVFFDDARLYPTSSPGPHFPTSDDLEELSMEEAGNEQWFSNPGAVRAQHRSRKWHDKQCWGVHNDQRVNEPQDLDREMEHLVPLPPLSLQSEEGIFGELAPFWQ
ncbi:hypothetical protein EDB81DRAFT_932578 [Dactylonectria macrodidyma]|uniref:Uncharacterized protein n=1 Tax=Dactylonectria macrodidyma TaxID=307937 RepID=A0A9P9J391_9HYPO|nr:hypothetical protein EDB81DRAFT_932578 [Dactylonectria macrodidyma]